MIKSFSDDKYVKKMFSMGSNDCDAMMIESDEEETGCDGCIGCESEDAWMETVEEFVWHPKRKF